MAWTLSGRLNNFWTKLGSGSIDWGFFFSKSDGKRFDEEEFEKAVEILVERGFMSTERKTVYYDVIAPTPSRYGDEGYFDQDLKACSHNRSGISLLHQGKRLYFTSRKYADDFGKFLNTRWFLGDEFDRPSFTTSNVGELANPFSE
jgi:hypothetical protein